MSSNDVDVEEAAGGLLWREDADARKLAIVYRERYGGGWTLPKGKREKDERWIETAVREVKEETGCTSIKVEDFAGCIWYLAEDKPKIVLFWNMSAEKKCDPPSDNEVTEVKWLTIGEAIKILRYPKEKSLISGGV